jgi:hypothetical protein
MGTTRCGIGISGGLTHQFCGFVNTRAARTANIDLYAEQRRRKKPVEHAIGDQGFNATPGKDGHTACTQGLHLTVGAVHRDHIAGLVGSIEP